VGTLAIVVPVFNGAADLERCLASLARHRPAGSTIVVVDDASTEPAIAPLLAGFARENADVLLITAPENRGFIASANAGAAAAPQGADILFLNSDTEVTAGWHAEMATALDAEPGAAVCCPLSNNATYLSIPKYQQPNELPPGWTADRMAALVRGCAGGFRSLAVPTPVGFCMLVRRETWNRVGPFDPAFDPGYGADDDFGQRVQAAGRTIACAPRAYVYHRGGVSFASTPPIAERRVANAQLLASRWPRYSAATRAWCQSNPLRPLHELVWQALLAPSARAVHVLHVVDQWELSGPMRTHLLGIARASADFALHTVVVPMPDRGAWLDAIDFEAGAGLRVVGLVDFDARFEKFLAASPANVVHFHAPETWMPESHVEMARRSRAVLTTPMNPDPARCAQVYRRVPAGA